jgi:hypothetical protein
VSARWWSAALALVGVVLAPQRAAPCSVCYCGDPTLLPLGLVQPEPGQLRLSIDMTYLRKESGGELDDPALTPRHFGGADEEQVHGELRATATGAFTFGDHSLSVVVPWVRKELASLNGSAVTRDQASGAGDIELYARRQWFFSHRMAPKRHIGALAIGLKVPTGNADAPDPETLDVMPGSGSFDALIGPSYTYDADPFSLYGSVLYRYNGEGSLGVRRGSSLLVNAAARYRLSDYVLLAAQLNGRMTAKDTLNQTADEDSGGVILFGAPQVVVRPKGKWALRAQAQIPLVERLFGAQRESITLGLGASYDL